MIKRLVRHRNSRAIVIDKDLNDKTDVFRENFKKLNKKYKSLMRNLAKL